MYNPFSSSSSIPSNSNSDHDRIHHHYQPLNGLEGGQVGTAATGGGGGGVENDSNNQQQQQQQRNVTFGDVPDLGRLQRRGRESRPLLMGDDDGGGITPATTPSSVPLYHHSHHPAPPPASSFMFSNDHIASRSNNNNNNNRQNRHQHGGPNATTAAAAPAGGSGGTVEDSLLWDQLNDEQSREVQQHQSRFHAVPLTSRKHPWTIVWSMTQSTAERFGTTAYSAWHAAKVAWDQYPARRRRRQQQSSSSSNPRGHTMDDVERQFGIHDLRDSTTFDDVEGGMFDDDNDGDDNNDNGAAASANGNSPTRGGRRRRSNNDNNNNNEIANGKPNPNYPFVMLRNFPRQMIYQSEQEQWGVVSNMDVFLTHLYQYYYHRGVIPMVCQFIVEVTSLFVTLWLSRMLLKNVNWSLLTTCKDEHTCLPHWSDYYYSSEYSPTKIGWMHWLLVQGYTLLFLLYGTFRCWTFWQSFQQALNCQHIVHEKLGISKRKLLGGAITWDEIVTKLCQVQASGEYKFALPQGQAQAAQATSAPATTTTTATIRRGGGRTEAAARSVPVASPAVNDNGDLASSADTLPSGAKSRSGDATSSSSRTTAMNGATNDTMTTTMTTTTTNDGNDMLMDPLWIAQRIMRKENFLIAFFNQGLLDTKVGSRYYWCPSLEWSVYTCVLNFMFNHKYEIRPAFYLDPTSLERRFVVCGIIHAILLPFLIMFVVLHFILRNVYDMKTTRQYMGDKQWSSYALWTFREFNELPHMFEQRLEPSYEAAEEYIKLFGTAEWMAALGKLFVFLGGAVGGILLLLGILNDAILLHVQYAGRNLFWYAGMAGIVYSIGKALLPIKEATPSVSTRQNLFTEMDDSLKRIATFTHYYPEYWKHRGWDAKNVYTSFKLLFDSRVKLFLIDELVGLILAPYILIVKLPSCSSKLCEFCLSIKSRIPNAGEVCGYSTFDFDRFNDENYNGDDDDSNNTNNNNEDGDNLDNNKGTTTTTTAIDKEQQRQRSSSILLLNETKNNATGDGGNNGETLAQSILRMGNVEDATRLHPKPRAKLGKMKQSFYSFQIMAHPTNTTNNNHNYSYSRNRINNNNFSASTSATINDGLLHMNDFDDNVIGGSTSLKTYKEDDEHRRNSARLLFTSSSAVGGNGNGTVGSASNHHLSSRQQQQQQQQQRHRQQLQQDWMARFEKFQRQEEERALSRERELYIEAAARQLETLERLERRQEEEEEKNDNDDNQQQQQQPNQHNKNNEYARLLAASLAQRSSSTTTVPLSSPTSFPSSTVSRQRYGQQQQQQQGNNVRQYIPPTPTEENIQGPVHHHHHHQTKSQSVPDTLLPSQQQYDDGQKGKLKSPPPPSSSSPVAAIATTPAAAGASQQKNMERFQQDAKLYQTQQRRQPKLTISGSHSVQTSSPPPPVSPPSTPMLQSIKPRRTPQRNGSRGGSTTAGTPTSTSSTTGRSINSPVGGFSTKSAVSSPAFTRNPPPPTTAVATTTISTNKNGTTTRPGHVLSPNSGAREPSITTFHNRNAVSTAAAATASSVQYYNDASESVFYEAIPSVNNTKRMTTTAMVHNNPATATDTVVGRVPTLNPIATSQLMTTTTMPSSTAAPPTTVAPAVVAGSGDTTIATSKPIGNGRVQSVGMTDMTTSPTLAPTLTLSEENNTIDNNNNSNNDNNNNPSNPIPWMTEESTEAASGTDRRTSERQYYWLERFHEHLEEQEQQQMKKKNEEQPQQQQQVLHPSSRSLPSSFAASASSIMKGKSNHLPTVEGHELDRHHQQQHQQQQRLYQSLNYQNMDGGGGSNNINQKEDRVNNNNGNDI